MLPAAGDCGFTVTWTSVASLAAVHKLGVGALLASCNGEAASSTQYPAHVVNSDQHIL
jgi:hypothetical protein